MPAFGKHVQSYACSVSALVAVYNPNKSARAQVSLRNLQPHQVLPIEAFEDFWLDAEMDQVLVYLRGADGLELPECWRPLMRF